MTQLLVQSHPTPPERRFDRELAQLVGYAELARSAAAARVALAVRDAESIETLEKTAAALALFAAMEGRTHIVWSWTTPRLARWSIRREAGIDRRGRIRVRWVMAGGKRARRVWQRVLPKEVTGPWTAWTPRDPIVRPNELASQAALALAQAAHEARTLVRRAARLEG